MADPHSPSLKSPITPAQSVPLAELTANLRERAAHSATEVTGIGGTCSCGPETSREKYWSELGLTDQIERMRMMVRRSIADIGELEDKVERLSNALLQHTHNPIGQPQVPLKGEDLRPRRSKLNTLRSLGLDKPTDEDYF